MMKSSSDHCTVHNIQNEYHHTFPTVSIVVPLFCTKIRNNEFSIYEKMVLTGEPNKDIGKK